MTEIGEEWGYIKVENDHVKCELVLVKCIN
jgi:hypothetical protein